MMCSYQLHNSSWLACVEAYFIYYFLLSLDNVFQAKPAFWLLILHTHIHTHTHKTQTGQHFRNSRTIWRKHLLSLYNVAYDFENYFSMMIVRLDAYFRLAASCELLLSSISSRSLKYFVIKIVRQMYNTATLYEWHRRDNSFPTMTAVIQRAIIQILQMKICTIFSFWHNKKHIQKCWSECSYHNRPIGFDTRQ